jgi:pSer/pThr/pTyr-binding forkhead associated (FHA) protein
VLRGEWKKRKRVQHRIVLKYLSGRKAGSSEVFPLPRTVYELKIGRDPACDIRFDAILDTSVSRHHASLQWRDERVDAHYLEAVAAGVEIELDDEHAIRQRQFELVDLISSNGTFLNGKRIEHAHVLKDGDEIQFGRNGPKVRIEIQDPDQPTNAHTPKTETIPAVQAEFPSPAHLK